MCDRHKGLVFDPIEYNWVPAEFEDVTKKRDPKFVDMVEHPDHYTKDKKVETWDWIELGMTDDMFRGYLLGNIWKYTQRFPDKDSPILDLKKSIQYILRLIRFEKGERMEVLLKEEFTEDPK